MTLREQLIHSVRSDDNEKVSEVLDKMSANEVNEVGEDGLTALCVAYWCNNIEAINLLLAKPGIDVNAKHRDGYTILTIVCIEDLEHVTELLANPDVDQNAKDDCGRTPIFQAAANCSIMTLEVMLQSPHVDLDVKTNSGMGLEDYVGVLHGSEEDKKKCLEMIREEKLRRLKVSEIEESEGTEIEKTKGINQREDCDKNCSSDTKHIVKDEHFGASEDNSDSANSIKSSPDPTTKEKPLVRLARIVFDATDMGKGFKTLKLNAATPMIEIKKLFSKHLGVDEESFMMCYNNQEVKKETPLELFGNNLDGNDNVISIVKTIRKDKVAFCDKPESSHPERETEHVLASNAESGQKEVNTVKKDKRFSFKWLGSKMASQHTQPARIKPKCILASCQNPGRHRCDRCKAVYYCRQECLSEDWSHHKMYCDYVYKASKDVDYVYQENSVPDDSSNEGPKETGNSGGIVEEVD